MIDRSAVQSSGESATVAGACENCGLITPFLFEGLFFDLVIELAAELSTMPMRQLNKMKFLSEPFLTTRAMVCFRCRPLSNLEVLEMQQGAPKAATDFRKGKHLPKKYRNTVFAVQ